MKKISAKDIAVMVLIVVFFIAICATTGEDRGRAATQVESPPVPGAFTVPPGWTIYSLRDRVYICTDVATRTRFVECRDIGS